MVFKVLTQTHNVAVWLKPLHLRGIRKKQKHYQRLLKWIYVFIHEVITALANSSLCTNLEYNLGVFLWRSLTCSVTCYVKLKCGLAESSKCTKKICAKLEKAMYLFFSVYVTLTFQRGWRPSGSLHSRCGTWSDHFLCQWPG